MSPRTTLILSFTLFTVGLLWGIYTLLVYVGMPIHQLVYLNSAQMQAVDQACGTLTTISTYLCRGVNVFPTFLGALVAMGSPFIPYIVISLIAYVGFLFWRGYTTGVFRAEFSMRPLVLIGAFFVALWLLATTLSLTTLYNHNTPDAQRMMDVSGTKILPPFRRFLEPQAGTFQNISPKALLELQANYSDLLDRGCLTQETNAQGETLSLTTGEKVYNLSFLCLQQRFFSRVGLQVFMVLFFLLDLLVLGRAFLAAIRLRPLHPLLHMVLSLGIGAFLLVAILWTAAVLGVLSGTVAAAVFFAIPVVLFPWTWQWFQDAWKPSISVTFDWKSVHVFLLWLLISYLALNFLNVVRPFPIGWDDLGSYLNRPRLLASYGSFIPTMSQFQWEYLTSLGFLIFGYDNPVGSTFSMQINWTAGLLAVIVAYAFGRLFLGKGRGVLTAILYYFLPMTGHFSFADMKIDNASFFTSVLAILAVAVVCFKSGDDDDDAVAGPDWRLLLVAGLVAGFSFAVKPTAILSIMLCIALLGGSALGWWAFSAVTFVGFLLLALFGPLSIHDILTRAGFSVSISSTLFISVLFLIAVGALALALRSHRARIAACGRSVGIFVLGIALACVVWGAHNVSINRSLSVRAMLSALDTTAPQVFYEQKEQVDAMRLAPTIPVRTLTPELKLDPNNPACKTSARAEELDRYWGFDHSIYHYLTLPWRQVMNVDAFGYYVTLTPALLLFPLLLLLPFFWKREARWLRFLTAGTAVFIIQWMFVANGVIWYGVGMFIGLSLALEALVAYAPNRQTRALFSILLIASVIICLENRFWQFDSQKNIFEYSLGKMSAGALREVTIPEYENIRDSVVSRHESLPETPYTYRIGTFISYFIPRNREIFPLADHQLGIFNCLNQERDHALTLRRLKALGFNSIIFDTNTQTIEKDPQGSLHRKVESFLQFINDPATKVSIVVNDPGNGIAYILLP